MKERVEYIHTGWHCSKCGKELVQPSNEPAMLQKTLDPKLRVAKCPRCRGTRMYRHVSQM